MLIISDFRDYYDNVLSQGVDKTIVYKRRSDVQHEVEADKIIKNAELIDSINRLDDLSRNLEYILVYFCGKWTPAIKMIGIRHVSLHDPSIVKEITKDMVSYDANSFLEYVGKGKDRKYVAKFRYNRRGDPDEKLENCVRKLFDIKPNDFTDYLYQHKTVIAVLHNFKWHYTRKPVSYSNLNMNITYNPVLSQYDFVKVVDPYTAAQEIMMYISGVIGSPSGEILQISDKDMVMSKGFDVKYGFRTRPKQ